jgi:hypothetical protein
MNNSVINDIFWHKLGSILFSRQRRINEVTGTWL